MKVRLIARSDMGELALVEFLHECSRKKSVKEKIALMGVSKFGTVRAKLFKQSPYTLVVSYSSWRKYDKSGVPLSAVLPVVEEYWLKGLEYSKDYEVRLV